MAGSRKGDNSDRGTNQEPGRRPDDSGPPDRPSGRPGDGSGPPGSGPPGNKPAPGMQAPRGLLAVVSIFLVVFLGFMLLNSAGSSGQQLSSWREFRTLYQNGQIDPASVEIRDAEVFANQVAEGARGEKGPVYFRFGPTSRDFYVKEVDALTDGQYRERPSSMWTPILMSFLPLLIIILIVMWLLMRGLRSAAGGGGGMLGSFGKSRHKVLVKEKTGITFDDVAGINEAKDEVGEIIEFLKAPKKFMRLGGRIPRGVLLVGEPGCGKTLLAKAIAGEADVPFFSISGSDFVEMFVGVGASRVRDLFKQAKESAPCIIFLDEIDAVGRRRGGGFTTGGHDEREQTLNAILVEMDGFNSGDGVIVVAATNRSDVLDPALTRPGRFDRQIIVNLPDVKGRLEILKVHGKKVKLGPDVNLERLAKATPSFSGADLAAIINEAAISATLQNKEFIEHEDLEEARDKVKFGRAKKSRVREVEENRLTAYHEAGHAVLQVLLKDADPLHKVTIIPRGQAGGATFSLPERDRMGYSLRWLKATMRVLCGGRIAENRAMGDMSSGASMDIMQVTRIARTMIEEWGMSTKLGFVRYAAVDTREMYMGEKAYSEGTAALIDQEVRAVVDEAYAEAERMLVDNWDKVTNVAEALLKYETLDAADVLRVMRGEAIGKPTVADLLAAEARKAAAAAVPPSVEAQPPLSGGTGDLPGGLRPA
ncbi:MAG: ATP-dependent zinc metalloprotease FtsH [Planctomycetaceae bacterium]|jgi:cell division protease FtsH|nr:ATP-dependent zinc metalloprotease FtsH [Phycisphaerales bacterium]MCE2653261.1 ATP-dependent zinc metalloprotease FtsH [Planctomycetaceae bacterium]